MSNLEDTTMLTHTPKQQPTYEEILCTIYKQIHHQHLLKQYYKKHNKLDMYYQSNGAILSLMSLLCEITDDTVETVRKKVQKLIKECEKQ